MKAARFLVGGLLLLALSFSSPASAGVTLSVRPGDWTDVSKHPAGYAQAYAAATSVSVEVNGALEWRALLPEPTLYLRMAVDQTSGRIVTIAQGNASGSALLVERMGARSLGPSFGQNAVAIRWSATDGFIAYVQTKVDAYDLIAVDTGDRVSVPMPATSQGFRDVLPDGEVRRGDDWFVRQIRGYSLHEPSEQGHIYAGQWSIGAPGIGVVFEGSDVAFTVLDGLGFEPHLALLAGERFAVAVRAPVGAVLALVSPPYPPTEPGDREKSRPPPTDPIDKPKPEQVPDDSAIAKAEADRHPDVLAAMRAGSDACDARRSQGLSTEACEQEVNNLKARMTRFIAFAVHQVHANWGLRRKDAGAGAVRPQDGIRTSTDVLMWRTNGQIVDVVSDRTAGGWGLTPGDTQPLEQWVEPLPEPGSTPTDPTKPTDPPPPTDPTELVAIKAAILAILQEVTKLEGKIDALAATVADVGPLTAQVELLRQDLAENMKRGVVFPDYKGSAKVLGQAVTFTLRPVK